MNDLEYNLIYPELIELPLTGFQFLQIPGTGLQTEM
jgi:hypothetical protein